MESYPIGRGPVRINGPREPALGYRQDRVLVDDRSSNQPAERIAKDIRFNNYQEAAREFRFDSDQMTDPQFNRLVRDVDHKLTESSLPRLQVTPNDHGGINRIDYGRYNLYVSRHNQPEFYRRQPAQTFAPTTISTSSHLELPHFAAWTWTALKEPATINPAAALPAERQDQQGTLRDTTYSDAGAGAVAPRTPIIDNRSQAPADFRYRAAGQYTNRGVFRANDATRYSDPRHTGRTLQPGGVDLRIDHGAPDRGNPYGARPQDVSPGNAIYTMANYPFKFTDASIPQTQGKTVTKSGVNTTVWDDGTTRTTLQEYPNGRASLLKQVRTSQGVDTLTVAFNKVNLESNYDWVHPDGSSDKRTYDKYGNQTIVLHAHPRDPIPAANDQKGWQDYNARNMSFTSDYDYGTRTDGRYQSRHDRMVYNQSNEQSYDRFINNVTWDNQGNLLGGQGYIRWSDRTKPLARGILNAQGNFVVDQGQATVAPGQPDAGDTAIIADQYRNNPNDKRKTSPYIARKESAFDADVAAAEARYGVRRTPMPAN